MFILFSSIVLLVPAILGGYMLFTPMERLIASVAWMRLPMPKEGTSAYALLRAFWRGIGVVAWLFVALGLYLLFFKKT